MNVYVTRMDYLPYNRRIADEKRLYAITVGDESIYDITVETARIIRDALGRFLDQAEDKPQQ